MQEFRYPPSPYISGLFYLQLENLDRNLKRRRELANIYARELGEAAAFHLQAVADGALPAWIQYPVFVGDKDDCYRYLLSRSIDINWTYRYSSAESYGDTGCPNATQAAKTAVGLPTFPQLSDADAYQVCSAMREYLSIHPSIHGAVAGR